MQRRNYIQDRSELDREAYRDGFLAGYEAGVTAATEYHNCDLFTYEEWYDPARPPSILEEEKENKGDKSKVAREDLAYQIGYSDAFDRGYQALSRALEQTLAGIWGGQP